MVTITAFAPPPGMNEDDCLDVVTVFLEQPLGDRRVVDGSTRRTVTVNRRLAPEPCYQASAALPAGTTGRCPPNRRGSHDPHHHHARRHFRTTHRRTPPDHSGPQHPRNHAT